MAVINLILTILFISPVLGWVFREKVYLCEISCYFRGNNCRIPGTRNQITNIWGQKDWRTLPCVLTVEGRKWHIFICFFLGGVIMICFLCAPLMESQQVTGERVCMSTDSPSPTSLVPEGSSPCLQKTTIGSCPDQVKHTSYFHKFLVWEWFEALPAEAMTLLSSGMWRHTVWRMFLTFSRLLLWDRLSLYSGYPED
jgi:hypothetical protein